MLPLKILENEDQSKLLEEIAFLLKGNYEKIFKKL